MAEPFKVGDRVESFNGKITGTVAQVYSESILLAHMIGEILPPGCAPIYESADFRKESLDRHICGKDGMPVDYMRHCKCEVVPEPVMPHTLSIGPWTWFGIPVPMWLCKLLRIP